MDLTRKRIPAKYLQEYLDTVMRAQQFQLSNVRHWTLLQCYAELQFQLNGGSKCPVCRAHVRHVVPISAQRSDGSVHEFPCLCTRCFEGERATSAMITMQIGEAKVDYKPRIYGAHVHKAESFPKRPDPLPKPTIL